jgi:hypothetical protein
MAMTLNGVTIHPSDAPKKKSKVGKLQTTANGGRTFIQRTTALGAAIHKSEWALTWQNVTETIRAQIEAIYTVAATMTYVDQHGTSYTVICEENGYNDSVAIIAPDNVTLYYNVSLAIVEA